GPYKLDHWEPGVQLEGSAFANHVDGPPKIGKVVIRIFIDENQTMASLLAGDNIDFACCNTLRFAQLTTLKNQRESQGRCLPRADVSPAVFLFQQLRPEYVGDEAMLDLRVRKALATAIDRQAISDGVFDGLGAPTDTPAPPSAPFAPELDRIM